LFHGAGGIIDEPALYRFPALLVTAAVAGRKRNNTVALDPLPPFVKLGFRRIAVPALFDGAVIFGPEL
jgi:hypothetical protein